MNILLPTLFVFNAFVYALLGFFLYFMWREDKAEEFRCWSFGFFLNCEALLVFAGREIAEFLSIVAGNALSLWGMGLIWAGIRVFAERPIRKVVVLAGGLIWIIGFSQADPFIRFDGRISLVAIYAFLVAYELYSYNKERVPVVRATAALARFSHPLFSCCGRLSAGPMGCRRGVAEACIFDPAGAGSLVRVVWGVF